MYPVRRSRQMQPITAAEAEEWGILGLMPVYDAPAQQEVSDSTIPRGHGQAGSSGNADQGPTPPAQATSRQPTNETVNTRTTDLVVERMIQDILNKEVPGEEAHRRELAPYFPNGIPPINYKSCPGIAEKIDDFRNLAKQVEAKRKELKDKQRMVEESEQQIQAHEATQKRRAAAMKLKLFVEKEKIVEARRKVSVEVAELKKASASFRFSFPGDSQKIQKAIDHVAEEFGYKYAELEQSYKRPKRLMVAPEDMEVVWEEEVYMEEDLQDQTEELMDESEDLDEASTSHECQDPPQELHDFHRHLAMDLEDLWVDPDEVDQDDMGEEDDVDLDAAFFEEQSHLQALEEEDDFFEKLYEDYNNGPVFLGEAQEQMVPGTEARRVLSVREIVELVEQMVPGIDSEEAWEEMEESAVADVEHQLKNLYIGEHQLEDGTARDGEDDLERNVFDLDGGEDQMIIRMEQDPVEHGVTAVIQRMLLYDESRDEALRQLDLERQQQHQHLMDHREQNLDLDLEPVEPVQDVQDPEDPDLPMDLAQVLRAVFMDLEEEMDVAVEDRDRAFAPDVDFEAQMDPVELPQDLEVDEAPEDDPMPILHPNLGMDDDEEGYEDMPILQLEGSRIDQVLREVGEDSSFGRIILAWRQHAESQSAAIPGVDLTPHLFNPHGVRKGPQPVLRVRCNKDLYMLQVERNEGEKKNVEERKILWAAVDPQTKKVYSEHRVFIQRLQADQAGQKWVLPMDACDYEKEIEK